MLNVFSVSCCRVNFFGGDYCVFYIYSFMLLLVRGMLFIIEWLVKWMFFISCYKFLEVLYS